MYEIVYTNRMKRDAKLMKKRGRNLEKLVEVLNLLASGNPLPQKYKDHQLTGNLNDFREPGQLVPELLGRNNFRGQRNQLVGGLALEACHIIPIVLIQPYL